MSPFLAWGDFHARSRFARSTISEEKWGTTRSLIWNRPVVSSWFCSSARDKLKAESWQISLYVTSRVTSLYVTSRVTLLELQISHHFCVANGIKASQRHQLISETPSRGPWSKVTESLERAVCLNTRICRPVMFKLGFAFFAVALFVCSSYAADLLTEDVDSLMEYSNRNF